MKNGSVNYWILSLLCLGGVHLLEGADVLPFADFSALVDSGFNPISGPHFQLNRLELDRIEALQKALSVSDWQNVALVENLLYRISSQVEESAYGKLLESTISEKSKELKEGLNDYLGLIGKVVSHGSDQTTRSLADAVIFQGNGTGVEAGSFSGLGLDLGRISDVVVATKIDLEQINDLQGRTVSWEYISGYIESVLSNLKSLQAYQKHNVAVTELILQGLFGDDYESSLALPMNVKVEYLNDYLSEAIVSLSNILAEQEQAKSVLVEHQARLAGLAAIREKSFDDVDDDSNMPALPAWVDEDDEKSDSYSEHNPGFQPYRGVVPQRRTVRPGRIYPDPLAPQPERPRYTADMRPPTGNVPAAPARRRAIERSEVPARLNLGASLPVPASSAQGETPPAATNTQKEVEKWEDVDLSSPAGDASSEPVERPGYRYDDATGQYSPLGEEWY